MKGFEIRVLKGRGRHIAIGVSVLVHGLALAYYVNRPAPEPDRAHVVALIPMDLEKAPEPVVQQPVVKAKKAEQKALAKAGGPPGMASQRKARPAVKGRAEQLNAILAMDLNGLRVHAVELALFTPKLKDVGEWEAPAPVEPDVHLSDATIDQIVSEGRGYVNEGKKKGRGIGSGGGMCPAQP
ncbi:MAG: hypothetical protein O7G87_09785 [bacterium]|nr:hypothetical protein [bacterium]